MTTQIEKLTAEQEAQLPVYANAWIKIGLNTDPADRKATEEGLAMAYREAGLEPPKTIKWVNDPLEAAQFLIEASKGTKFPVTATNALSSVFFGQHEAGWMAFNDYMGTVLGVKGPERLAGLMQVARSCSWVWLYRRVAVCLERPRLVKLTSEAVAGQLQELHCVDGPAFEWRSGLKHYFIRGVPVDAKLFEGKPTAQEIMAIDNSEVRRVMIERYGAGKFLTDLGAKQIQQDERGTLFRMSIPNDEDLVMVRYVNRSPEYGMDECPFCHEEGGQAISFSCNGEQTGKLCKCGSFVYSRLKLEKGARILDVLQSKGANATVKNVIGGGGVGLFKVYWHRVPPDTKTATEAFRWMYKDVGGVKKFNIVAES